tara:strand:+ start:77 stop:229 length:153 start_codon:yes stop_codon:yes gene_type:complete
MFLGILKRRMVICIFALKTFAFPKKIFYWGKDEVLKFHNFDLAQVEYIIV